MAIRPDALAGGVLVTGFDPFGGEAVNPSGEVARRLHGSRSRDGVPIAGVELPTVFGAAAQALARAIERERPRLVIATGLAGSRDEVSIERFAINLDDARIADNAGAQPVDSAIAPGAPLALPTALPAKAIVAALRSAGIPAGLSASAGLFVCNHVFYALQHGIAGRWPGLRGGFIHLPPWHEPGGAGSLEDLVRAIRIAIEVSLSRADDLAVPGGAID